MKKIYKYIVLVLLISFSASIYSSCEDETIKSVGDEGGIIVLLDRTVWEIPTFDKFDTMLWLPGDQVLVCDNSTIINRDDNGEKVEAKRLK